MASALIACSAAAPAFGARSALPHLALTHATVIDGFGGSPRSDMTVLIAGSRIVDFFATGTKRLPSETRVVDLTGQFVIPGMIDSHVHLGTQERPPGIMRRVMQLVFMDGVTTVRDMGGSAAIVQPLVQHSRADTARLPRVYHSAVFAGPGRWFEGPFGTVTSGGAPMGTSPTVRRVGSGTDVKRLIADARAAGVTGIKLYNTIDTALVSAIIREAHRQRLRVWSHLSVDPGRPAELIAAGVDVVSHADQFRGQLVGREMISASDTAARAVRRRELRLMSPDTPEFTAILEAMRRRGTILDPTLSVMLPLVPDTSAQSREPGLSSFQFAAAMTRRANRMGIPIVAGTDHIGGSTATIHAELQLLVDSAGLTPLQAIRAATLNGAVALGAQDSVGTIAIGKLADLLILRANPAANIRNTQTISAVMKGGRLYQREGVRRQGPLAAPPPSD